MRKRVGYGCECGSGGFGTVGFGGVGMANTSLVPADTFSIPSWVAA